MTVVDTGTSGDVAVIAERGEGRPVLALGADFADTPAHAALAQRFRVSVITAASGAALAAWVAARGLEGVGLLATGSDAGLALAAAEAAGEAIKAVVLVSPEGVLGQADGRRPGGRTPKAVLIGSRDLSQPPGVLALYRKALAASHSVLVYGAGRDIAADRPEAFADVAGDFFDRQGRFNFITDSVALRHD